MNEMVKTVNFHGDELAVVEKDGKPWVAMKPICEAMELDWEAQRQMIERDPVLRQVTCILQATSSGKDGKTYNVEMICLPLDFLNGWLFKLDASRYEGGRRDVIMAYQRECYSALYDYWHRGVAVNPRNAGSEISSDAFKSAVNWLGKKSNALLEDVHRVKALAASLEKDIAEIKAKLSPQFPVREHPFFQFCHLGQTQYAVKDDLYDAYITYADIAGEKAMSKGVFFKWLYASGYPIRTGHMAMNGRQIPVVYGIAMKEHRKED